MCLFPINAEHPPEGGRVKLSLEGSLRLPCGKCTECISKRAMEWSLRAKHEISEASENSFITLTYNNENLNSNFIIKKDFQKFIKRLRKKLKTKIKYMVSYEYGKKYFRPHMHAIIFGYNPSNQKFLKNTPSGHPIFTSKDIGKLWDKGYHSIGVANEQTAYYIASYALKGKKKTIYHPNTGESIEIADTMDVSKRPSIGLNYFAKNYQQLINTNTILPRYYLKILQEHAEALTDKENKKILSKRQKYILNLFPNLTDDLFAEYQDRQTLQIKNRSDGENYAKFVISNQKTSLSSTHLREDALNPYEQKLRRYQTGHLKHKSRQSSR